VEVDEVGDAARSQNRNNVRRRFDVRHDRAGGGCHVDHSLGGGPNAASPARTCTEPLDGRQHTHGRVALRTGERCNDDVDAALS
jgi:hypothetical protein